MHDITVMSHALIFVKFLVELLFFLGNGKHVTEMMQIHNYCLTGDLKYMDLNQENKIYWLKYQFEHKYYLYNNLKN